MGFITTSRSRRRTRSGWEPTKPGATCCCPPIWGSMPRHAILVRSALNRLLMLVDLSGGQAWVNQHPVVKLRVLRQGDRLQLGRCDLERVGSADHASCNPAMRLSGKSARYRGAC